MRSFHDDIRRVYLLFLAGDVILVLAKVVIDSLPGALPHLLEQTLDLGREGVVAAWFSSAQLLVVGLLAGAHLYVRADPDSPAARRRRWGWAAVAAIFVWLSMDEVGQVHEGIGMSLASRLGPEGMAGRLKDVYLWLLPFAPIVIAGGIYLAIFCWSELGGIPAARLAALGGVALFVFAWLAEVVESQRFAASGARVVRVSRGWNAVLEEGCEVAGATAFLVAFGESLRRRRRRREAPPPQAPA